MAKRMVTRAITVTDERSELSAQQAFREIGRFGRFLFQRTGPSQMLIATLLALLGGLSEGVTLSLLLSLLRLLDSAAGSARESMTWLPHVFQSLGIRLNLLGFLTIFLGMAAARSLINRQRFLYLSTLRLNLMRNMRVGLYSGIAQANWPFLRRARPGDLLSALTAEIDRLDVAAHYALETPARALRIGVHVAVAFLIAPELTLLALATGTFLAWLVRGCLAESLHLGKRLSAAYQDFYHCTAARF
jgi:ATP-binding cassette subfamily C protein